MALASAFSWVAVSRVDRVCGASLGSPKNGNGRAQSCCSTLCPAPADCSTSCNAKFQFREKARWFLILFGGKLCSHWRCSITKDTKFWDSRVSFIQTAKFIIESVKKKKNRWYTRWNVYSGIDTIARYWLAVILYNYLIIRLQLFIYD